MQIQVNTDRHIEGHEKLAAHVTHTVESALGHLGSHITRVEVHLSDVNSGKKGGGDDMRCLMEARLEGQAPVAVTHQAATVGQALDGAVDKLKRKISSNLGRLRDQKTRARGTARPEAEPEPDFEPGFEPDFEAEPSGRD